MRALTDLKQAGAALQKHTGAGRAQEMPLTRIHADPNNARRPDDEDSAEGLAEQSELTQDIMKRGVKSPISLRPHPTIIGDYVVNYGHRRLKAAHQAGLETIPYFIDENFDSYDQVKENLLHRKSSIWALAEFVQRKLDEGQSKGEIAEGLGKSNQNLVTELLALVDAPNCLHHAYANGVKSPRTLYDLRRAYDEFPENVEVWCYESPKVTRDTIQELVSKCRGNLAATVDASRQPGASVCLERVTEVADFPATRASRGQNAEGPVERLRDSLDKAQTPALASPPSPTPPNLRHDVEGLHLLGPSRAPSDRPWTATGATRMVVEYQGKRACFAPNATVMIVMEGQDTPLQVPVAELNFKTVR